MPGFAIVGSSPEILVRVREGEVTIRPIAGTRPRGANAAADRAAEQSLLADPKERAEHLMLLDLGRNDVGRVARAGTVTVTESFTVERYSHVMHIVSNVTGELDPHKDAIDALFAGFPAGTVSGAPKVRACEIIAELEPATAAQRFGDDSASLLARLRTDPDLDVEAIYPVARTASDLATFVAIEMHLIARMLDPTYEPDDARTLMRTLNESLRSMLGHGAEDWVSERVKPWRNMVIRRGLAWP